MVSSVQTAVEHLADQRAEEAASPQSLFKEAVEAHSRGDYEAALRGYRGLSHMRNARHNLGALLSQLGRLDEAIAALRPIVAQHPNFSASQYSLSMVLLAQESYEEGWRLYESRRIADREHVQSPETAVSEWRGEDLRGRRIVVCAEQGYGDQLMFGRYLPLLRDRGAEVVVACNSRMRPLFASLGYDVVPLSRLDDLTPAADFWVLMGSLPYCLGVRSPPPPLAFPPWRGGGGVGVVPTGDPRHGNDRHRSLPADLAARLLSLGRDLRPEATGARDFRESAELFAGLDLVITVDTVAAHLAGSIGVPTWVLLPAVGTDWRWLRETDTSPWYPSVRLFRQTAPGDWGSVLERVTIAIAKRSPPEARNAASH